MSSRETDLLSVEGLSKSFPVVRGVLGKTVGELRAVDDVSFRLRRGETLGLVGESGCGKTTAGRSILRLIEPSAGRVVFDGTDVTALSSSELRPYRRRMQIVFQDPFGSLNPRMRVVDIIGEGIERHGLASGAAVEVEVRALLARVGLPGGLLNRFPYEFSGGQRQRIGIARAIAVQPELVVCDEAVSALDVSVQAQVLNLLIDLRRQLSLAYLFIAHDLSVVRHISDHVAVMYLGRIVELGPCAELFDEPAHPYTRALLSAIPERHPRARRRRVVLAGDVPSPLAPPPGCHFHPRCPAALDRCSEAPPPVVSLAGARRTVRCVHAEGLEAEPDWYALLEQRLQRAEATRAPSPAGPRPLPPARPTAFVREAAIPVAAPTLGSEPNAAAPATAVAADGVPTALVLTADAVAADELGPPRDEARERAMWVPGAFALLLVGAGAGLTCWGRYGGGLVLIAAGGLGLQALEPRWLGAYLARRLGRALALAWFACALSSLAIAPLRRSAQARADLARLRGEIDAYARNVGHLPPGLGELRFRTLERFGMTLPKDPWGQPYRYERGADVGSYDLSSDGPDGLPSVDDLRE
jgi:oligopeptide/dipeptide ABC transporter ATP-binding protein